MKNIFFYYIKFVLSIILFPICSFSQPGWVKQESLTTNPLNSVYFINTNTGYIVGGYWNFKENSCVILKTTNGGENWFLQDSQSKYSLESVWFNDNYTGYAVGRNATIIKTTNGGLNWVIQSTNTKGYFTSLYFINLSTGYFSADFDDYSKIFKTTNGGEKWLLLKNSKCFSLR
ncbi:MAG: YCF48-related protein, partial [Ignavibacteriae bacterium]|nr:YCF48-related protein [Ignavibacteriota bacterium]